MAAERPQGQIKKTVERIAELSQKLDVVVFIIGGGIILLGYKTLGWVIVFGNAITYVGAEVAKKWARKGKKPN